MEPHTIITSIFFSGLLYISFINCEKSTNGPDDAKWVCDCDASSLPKLNSISTYNCSTSCHCVPDGIGVPGGVRWNCSCASLVIQATESIHKSSCFSSCKCTSGLVEASAGQKRITSKDVVVILLACVVFILVTLFVSIAFRFYRKEKLPLQRRIYSSMRETSSNSSTNLTSYRSTSFLRIHHKFDTLTLSPFTDLLRKISTTFGVEKQIIPGSLIQFSFSELEQATDRFSNTNLIGQGVSSNVFLGKLMDGRVVAIKKLKVLSDAEAVSIFLTEIELISRLNHCHVVPLLGYCSEYQGRNCERLLVFEYMLNGNLRDCLDAKHGREPLSWATRIRVAFGAAKGLEYLHEASAPRILHRDIKSTNILLDENYRPKITDLGMAKCLMADDHPSCSSSPARMMGTFGYFAPEYAIVGKASLKSDVFSYGVVILELITGRQPIQKSAKGHESLVLWSTARLNDSRLVIAELPDPLLKGNFSEEEMQIMAHLARECLQWDPDSRPTMAEIVQILATIAPEKHQRRNFHESFHRGLSWGSIKGIPAPERPPHSSTEDGQTQGSSGGAEGQSSVSDQNREKTDPVRAHFSQQPPTADHELVLSAEWMQQLVFLASAIHSRRLSEEDVDLTEPRFESFL